MRGLYELQYEAEQLGLDVRPGQTKDDIMDTLAVYYRKHDGTRSPLLKQFPVILARDLKKVSESKMQEILENKERMWIAEEKLDEVRAKMHLFGSGQPIRIDSKHRSATTYEYVEKTAQLPHLSRLICPNKFAGTILDVGLQMPVEVIRLGKTQTDNYLTSTCATINSSAKRAIEIQNAVGWCRFYIFDMPFYSGIDLRNLPYALRYEKLMEFSRQFRFHQSGMGAYYIHLPIRCMNAFTNFYKQYTAHGGEGIMLKHKAHLYDSGKRSTGLYKHRKSNPADCFITGFTPGEGEFSGLVGALLVSMYINGRPQEVAAVQPGNLGFRQRISLSDGSLNPAMYNKVVEVTYFCKTKNGRFRHAVKGDFRDDKTPEECVEQEVEL